MTDPPPYPTPFAPLSDVQQLDDPAEILAYLDRHIARVRPDPELAFVVGACAGRLAFVGSAAVVREIEALLVAVHATAAGGWPELREALQRAQRVVVDDHAQLGRRVR